MLLYQPNAVLRIRSRSHFFYQCKLCRFKSRNIITRYIEFTDQDSGFLYIENEGKKQGNLNIYQVGSKECYMPSSSLLQQSQNLMRKKYFCIGFFLFLYFAVSNILINILARCQLNDLRYIFQIGDHIFRLSSTTYLCFKQKT